MGSLLPSSAFAQVQAGIPNIVVVDLKAVRVGSAAAQSLQEQANALRKSLEDDLNKKREDLRQKRRQLNDQRASLDAQTFQQRRAELDTLTQDLTRQLRGAQNSLDQIVAFNMASINQELLGIIAEIARETGANFVVDKAAVIIMAQTFDATAIALQRLNEKLPSLQMQVPPKFLKPDQAQPQ